MYHTNYNRHCPSAIYMFCVHLEAEDGEYVTECN